MYKTALQHVIHLIRHPTIWLYLIPSILIALGYFFIGDLLGVFELNDNISGADVSWWDSFISGLGQAVYLVYSEIYKFFLLTILSPVMGLLSEKIEHLLNGKKFEFNFVRLMKDLLRAVAIFTTAFLFSTIFSLFLYLIAYIFGIQVIVPYIMYVFTGFFIGFSFFDYSLERYQYTIFESWKFAFQNKMMMVVSGVSFSLICLVPIIGIVLAPFATTLFSTSLWVEKIKSMA